MVNDPNFWKRFSVAVHEDEAAKKEMADRSDLKHSYVTSSSFSSSASPPVLSPIDLSFVLAPAPAALPSPGRRKEIWERDSWGPPPASREGNRDKNGEVAKDLVSAKPKRQPSKLQKSYSTRSTTRLLPASQQTQQQPLPPATPSTPAPTKQQHSPKPPPSPRHPRSFRCPSSLSLSGRPRHFKTWTTITANPSHRASWLESQKKKSRQRTWICWVFWLVLMLVVAGVVVTVLVLKSHHII
ncbi:hypothetical protein FB567DRAFT_576891 [Paraphoma chrysanthemicola]|uniref:Uncharacterized protein n=1 Tax=Paraphoma chrysanthemicola TaxID=798071 RepID=A0A8K0RGB9_9PLEO|nr:hypothetical protein FB567DRAFT_576891 [Paraphoma chrysanthemicola]